MGVCRSRRKFRQILLRQRRRVRSVFAHCDGSSAAWHVVGQRMPNFFGLFDMHGGLWEHTDSKYPAEHTPPELANTELFVRRGGAWYSPAVRCRSAQRNYHTANAVDVYTGVRLVMELRP